MSKECLITGRKTDSLCKNFPLSSEGRVLLKQLVEAYNNKLLENFKEGLKERQKESGDNPILKDTYLARYSPKINIKDALVSLTYEKESDLRNMLEELRSVK